jgi:serine/threonine protein kinase
LHIDHKPDKAAQQLQKNLLREARILANLRHTHIGQVYDIILEPLGIVMEWVEGPQLQEIIDAAKQLLLTDVINVGIEIADALRYAHTQRRPVIHRDIKPSNIMLTDDEERKSVLIDFDIASASGYETISLLEDGSRGYIGTLEYSAPEQLRKEAVGPLADMFALGVVLYELLADQRPYELGNDPSLYEGGHFPEPERSDIPEPLYQILCKLLREKPDQRPDAKTLKEELQNCLNL